MFSMFKPESQVPMDLRKALQVSCMGDNAWKNVDDGFVDIYQIVIVEVGWLWVGAQLQRLGVLKLGVVAANPVILPIDKQFSTAKVP